MYDDVRYETDDEIASVTSDRPNVYNAFRQQTIAELNVALREAIDDDGVYVDGRRRWLLRVDVSEMPNWHEELSKDDYADYLWGVQNVIRQLMTTDKLSIAAVDGPAIGADCDFALACIFGPSATTPSSRRNSFASALFPAMAIRRTNRLVNWGQSFDDYCTDATEYQRECVNDDEHHEAIAVFNERRDPEYDRDYG